MPTPSHLTELEETINWLRANDIEFTVVLNVNTTKDSRAGVTTKPRTKIKGELF